LKWFKIGVKKCGKRFLKNLNIINMKKLRTKRTHFLLKLICSILFTVFFFNGCQLYKKVSPLDSSAINVTKSNYLNLLITNQYYIILHRGNEVWHLKDLAIDSTLTNWNAEIETANEDYISFYRRTNSNHLPSYQKKEKQFLKQAHVFLPDSSMIFSEDKVAFNIASAKFEVLREKHNTGVFVGVIAIVPITLLLLYLIVPQGGYGY
jgi:hypothetical protein